MNIFWTPLPIVIASIIYSVLWRPNLATGEWAKIGRIICVIFIILNIVYWYSGFNAKINAGQRQAQTFFITQFTGRVSKLIE